MNNLRKSIIVVLASGISSLGIAQTAVVSWFQAKLDDKPAVNTLAFQIPRKLELWFGDATGPNPFVEILGSQLEYISSSGLFRLGSYIRFQNTDVVRLGGAGLVVIGKPGSWRLVSPYYMYMYAEKSEHGLNKTGCWFPNIRIVRSVGGGWSAGPGFAATITEDKQPSLVAGVYVSWENKETLIQLRAGTQLSPQPLTGKTQVFVGVGYRF